MVRRFHGMLYLSAKHSRSLVWWEDSPYERRFGQPSEGPIIPFGSLVEYYPISAKDHSTIHQFWKGSLTWIVPWTRSVRGWTWKGDINGCRHGDDGGIGNRLKKTQCKGSNNSPKNRKLIFPVADGRINFVGGDQELRTSTLIRDHPIRGEGQRDFLGESEGSPPPPPQDSLPDAGEAINDFWSMSGNFIYRHHVEPTVKLYSPKEESFPFPLKYIDVSRTTHTNLDVVQESRIDDYWNIDGSRDLSDSFGQVSLSSLYEVRNLQKDICGPRGHWQNGKRHPSQIIHGQNSVEDQQEMLSWGRSINGQLKNQSSIMHEDYEESISLTVRTRSSRKPSRMQEENWKHQWLPPCLARHARKVSKGRPVARLMISSLKLRVSWKPVNPQECVLKNLHQNIMRTILQEKGQFTTTLQYGTQICSHASSNEDTSSKSSSG